MNRLLALAACAAAVAACDERTPPPVAARNLLADSADQVMYHIRTVLTDRGLLRADVLADSAYFFDENSRIEMRGTHVIFYTQTGQKSATLTSKQGTYNTRINQTEARRDVVVVSEDGRRLESPQLRYDIARNLISSDSAFVMDAPGKHLEGIGFESDPDLKNIKIKQVTRNTKGTFNLPGT